MSLRRYVLHGAGLLDRPPDSSGLARWGRRGHGSWITVHAHRGHAYVVIAGLRFDTSGRGERGPRWRPERRSARSYAARHVEGLWRVLPADPPTLSAKARRAMARRAGESATPLP